MKKRRLFFALWPDAEIRQALALGQRQLGIFEHPVNSDNFHMTLSFLGDQPDDMMDAIGLAADGVVARSFEVVIDEVFSWTKTGIVGLHPSKPIDELMVLQADLQHALSVVGIAREKRAYKPHVTMARRADASSIMTHEIVPIHWRVNGFSLVESRLRSAGPIYDVLADWGFNY